MRVEVFLQSAAIKILRQKLSDVSFAAGFPFRLKMIHVFFTSVFYLILLATLGFFSLFVRLIGTAPDPEPEPSTPPPRQEKVLLALNDKPENKTIEEQLVQGQNIPKNTPELEDNEQPDNKIIPLPEVNSESNPDNVVIPEQQSSSRPNKAARLILSPLTLFLLRGSARNTEPLSEKLVATKLWRRAQKID